MYSRRLNVEEKQNKRKAIGFFLLTVSAILVMLFYGFPFLAKISNFAYDLRKTDDLIENSDQTPPPPPSFIDLQKASKNQKLDLKGRAEPGSTVLISVNGDTYEVLTNNDGDFSQTVSLSNGENIIVAHSKDSAGNKSHDSEQFTVVLDTEKPELEITSPKDGETFYGSKSKQITIVGKTEKDVQIQINDHLAIVDSNGNFSTFLGLNEGDNKVKIKAQDIAGNTTEKTLAVKYVP